MGARAGMVLGAVGLAVIVLAAIVAAHPGPLPGEVAYINGLQRIGGPVPTLAELTRRTTGTEAALVVAAGPACWLIVRFRRVGVEAAAIALVTMLVVQPLFKELVGRPRPDASQVEVRAEHSSDSFPSGHSLSTTTVWGVAAVVAVRRRRAALAAVVTAPIVLTGLAGGIQGVHWPSDSVAGTLTGAIAAVAIGDRLRGAGTVCFAAVPPEETG